MKWFVYGITGLLLAVNWFYRPELAVLLYLGLIFAYSAGRMAGGR